MSNDVRMLLPILVGILAAKWVADAATHSLYHGLLEVPLLLQPHRYQTDKTKSHAHLCSEVLTRMPLYVITIA